ncbi:phosphoribosyltransferase [Erythrobacter sp. GH1-10]|uniref:phosphoribosyltransferase n=1 Tax=Erythrobacter sp. GH1-10 TaxID=3349334 RepID=UPI00387802CC
MPHSVRFVYLIFAFAFVLAAIAGVLVFFERGGEAEFDILGQEFSSTNVGLAFLVLASLVFVYNVFFIRKILSSEASPILPSANDELIGWDEMVRGVDDLVRQLTSSGGFRPDLVIGICGGGLVVADILAKRLGHVPCVSLWASRHTSSLASAFSGEAEAVNRIDWKAIVTSNKVRRILVVDDVVYSGKTLRDGQELIARSLRFVDGEAPDIRTACFFQLRSAGFNADFHVSSDASKRKMLPVSDRVRS